VQKVVKCDRTLSVTQSHLHSWVHCDDRSSYIIFSMFFSHFLYVLHPELRSISAIAYYFEIFVMFFISESVILFFQNIAILECFDVIHEKIMQIGKTRHLKISKDLEKMKNEDSRGLGRRYKMRKTIHKFQDILYESKHPKRRKNRRHRAQTTLTCP